MMMKVYEGWTSPGNGHAVWLKDSPEEFFALCASFEGVPISVVRTHGAVRIRVEVLETFDCKPWSDESLKQHMEAR